MKFKILFLVALANDLIDAFFHAATANGLTNVLALFIVDNFMAVFVQIADQFLVLDGITDLHLGA